MKPPIDNWGDILARARVMVDLMGYAKVQTADNLAKEIAQFAAQEIILSEFRAQVKALIEEDPTSP